VCFAALLCNACGIFDGNAAIGDNKDFSVKREKLACLIKRTAFNENVIVPYPYMHSGLAD
jgi:hypothetical protein